MTDLSRLLLPAATRAATSLRLIAADDWHREAGKLSARDRTWAEAQGFSAAPLSLLPLAEASGKVSAVLVGAPRPDADPFTLGKLVWSLPPGTYRFADAAGGEEIVALAWLLEAYAYDPFRPAKSARAALVCPAGVDRALVLRMAETVHQVRDLVNTPANLLGPDELEATVKATARAHGARVAVTRGAALARNFPLIHVVGQASPRAPRLIDLTWGNPRHPKVTLVGKGVCFDSGGLDLKPAAGMALMKKDMGGAASVLGLARLVMAEKLPVRLRVLIPAVENAVSGAAFRPGDVFRTRKGLTVEIGNTDAEGRLILCEALALADEEKPDLLINMATLTGAARVALGPDLPPFYTDDDDLAAAIARHAAAQNDPLWRLPLWRPYDALYDSPVADMNNNGTAGFAGSIQAALFLRRFVERARSFVHFDLYAWVPKARPGRPMGGEAQAIRALFTLLRERHGKVVAARRTSRHN